MELLLQVGRKGYFRGPMFVTEMVVVFFFRDTWSAYCFELSCGRSKISSSFSAPVYAGVTPEVRDVRVTRVKIQRSIVLVSYTRVEHAFINIQAHSFFGYS